MKMEDEIWKMAAVILAGMILTWLLFSAAWLAGKLDSEVHYRLQQLDRIERALERLETRR